MEAYYAVYRKLMGHDPRPEEDITAEQLSGLKALFTSGAAPYVDLAIWGPFGQRTQRKLKLSGLVLGTDGVLQQVQLYGPPDVETWAAGFAVFRTGCIMLEEVSISTLALWSIMVSEYTARYGSAVWALIYQTEVRARSELLTRTKRAGATALAQSTAAGGSHSYNPNKPWDWVFREAAADVQFWRKELEEKALLILAKRPSSARCLVGLSCHHLHDVWFELGTQLRLVFVPTPVCSPQWVSFSHGCYSIPLMMFPAQPRCWLVIAGSSGFCLGTQALEQPGLRACVPSNQEVSSARCSPEGSRG